MSIDDICTECSMPIRFTGADPSVPWVHQHSDNGYCDVTVPEDAVMFAGTPGRSEATPATWNGGLAERSDGRQEVDATDEAESMYGCGLDAWCILRDGHDGDCCDDRDHAPSGFEETT